MYSLRSTVSSNTELTRECSLFVHRAEDVNDTALVNIGVVYRPSESTMTADDVTITISYVVKLEKSVTYETSRTISAELTYTGEPSANESLTASAVFISEDVSAPLIPYVSSSAHIRHRLFMQHPQVEDSGSVFLLECTIQRFQT